MAMPHFGESGIGSADTYELAKHAAASALAAKVIR
jgi:hypothetical protein